MTTRYTVSGHSFYSLTPLPGSSQIVVSHSAFTAESYRGKGHGKEAHQERLAHIRSLGYDYALCTVVADNVAQMSILRKAGWRLLATFVSSSSGNTINIMGRPIEWAQLNQQ